MLRIFFSSLSFYYNYSKERYLVGGDYFFIPQKYSFVGVLLKINSYISKKFFDL